MPSGYEQSEDYCGKDPGPWGYAGSVIFVVLLTLVLWRCHSDGSAQAPAPQEVIGRASVIDGDSIEIRGQNIRLWGIDAPEGKQTCTGPERSQEPAGRRSAAALAEVIGDRNVSCTQRDWDRVYNRPVSLCRVGDLDISKAMVERGWARAFVRYSRDYVEQERAAREARRGAWAWECKAPWEWRAEQRAKARKE